jgi:O-antigen chain-terminating methyltransferase
MDFDQSDRFYADFETRFRGPRSLVLQRLQAYLPLLAPLQEYTTSFSAIDLGCGRGEWLELLKTRGVTARGVDLSCAQLESCHKRNLSAKYNDAITELKSLAESSETLITAFHLVEHLPNKALRQLLQEALRVLIPGGLLILETPNPDNLSVGSNSFYLDPTHKRPIPELLLQFLVENAGFKDAHILRLQHNPALKQQEAIALSDVLQGASPDYAVVAIKSGVPHLNQALERTAKDYEGLTLQVLCKKFEQQQQRLEQQQQRLDQQQQRLDQQQKEFKAQLAQLESLQIEYQDQIKQEQQNIRMILESSSWQITKPLRLLKDFLLRQPKKPIS